MRPADMFTTHIAGWKMTPSNDGILPRKKQGFSISMFNGTVKNIGR